MRINPAWLHQASLTGLALTHTIVLSSWLARTLLFYLPWPPPFSLIWNFGSASDLPSNLDPNLICSSEVASAYLIGLTPTTREKKRPWVVGRCVSYKVGLLCLRRPLPASCLDVMADPPVSLVSTTCGFQINQIVGWVRGLA